MESKVKDYESLRNEIGSGDVLMYKGTGMTSWVIKKATGSEYSHAGIVVWWNNRLMVMEAVGKGVIVTPLSANIDHYVGDVEWYRSVDPISDDKRISMVQFAQKESAKKYSTWKATFLGMGRYIGLDFDKDDELKKSDQLFCSQYVSAIYTAVGVDLKKNTGDAFMVPDDIAISPKLIFKATLKKLTKK